MLALMSGKTPVISNAVILQGPKTLGLGQLDLTDPGPDDLVVDVRHSGISTGTEKLFWSGEMPPFPGMGYPLVPGYEAAGEVVAAGPGTGFKVGDVVFVPGANCYGEVKGLFGGAASRLVTAANRVVRIDPALGAEGALLALAALTDTGTVHGVDADIVAKRASPIFDNIRPRIGTVFEDLRATGRAMAEMLLRRMSGEAPERLNRLFLPDAPR